MVFVISLFLGIIFMTAYLSLSWKYVEDITGCNEKVLLQWCFNKFGHAGGQNVWFLAWIFWPIAFPLIAYLASRTENSGVRLYVASVYSIFHIGFRYTALVSLPIICWHCAQTLASLS